MNRCPDNASIGNRIAGLPGDRFIKLAGCLDVLLELGMILAESRCRFFFICQLLWVRLNCQMPYNIQGCFCLFIGSLGELFFHEVHDRLFDLLILDFLPEPCY